MNPSLISIDLSTRFQTIENFGGSDAWSCQFVGKWPDAQKKAIADLLFSSDLDTNGKPLGIGLSLWRFNVGAGSAQQGESSGIADEWRRAESFIGSDGEYDWNLQAGQMWFLDAAKKHGVRQFLAFVNSPPVNITINGKAFATNGQPNLSTQNFDAFAEYLVNVVQGVKQKIDVTFTYISPVNEPQWDWSDGGQEGTPFNNEDIAGIVTALDAALTRENLPSKITIVEAGKYDYLYSVADKPNRGNQIDAFFDPASDLYIGDLPSIENVIMGHGYFTTSPFSKAAAIRNKLRDKVAGVKGLKLWQSEYCILGDNSGTINGEHRDLGIKPALYVARVIHNDLVNANASAWHWWTTVSAYDYKDGLIYVDKHKSEGNFESSKLLWAVGNFSRFIRPGSYRIAADCDDPEVLVSAYVNPHSQELITVLINPAPNPKKVKLQDVAGGNLKEMAAYVTSSTEELAPRKVYSPSEVQLEALSITTLVSEIKWTRFHAAFFFLKPPFVSPYK